MMLRVTAKEEEQKLGKQRSRRKNEGRNSNIPLRSGGDKVKKLKKKKRKQKIKEIKIEIKFSFLIKIL